MGCCTSAPLPPSELATIQSSSCGGNAQSTSTKKSGKSRQRKKFARKSEPDSTTSDIITDCHGSETDAGSSSNDELIERVQSDLEIRMAARRASLRRQQDELAQKQESMFEEQVAAQAAGCYKRLYDVWEQHASPDGMTMDIHGLTKAVAVFGMIIDTDKILQRHIFSKFDLDNEHEITYNDFMATIASFVGSNTDETSLQTLFEIFDIDQDGYLQLNDMARILLAQNQITLVVTGQTAKSTVVYTKEQCLKQARRMVADADSIQFQDDKISFEEFKNMMKHRTDRDMRIDHMRTPSLSVHGKNDSNTAIVVSV